MPLPTHDCVVRYEHGAYERGLSRNERRVTRIDYRAGRCMICGRPHVFIPADAERSAALDIRRHVAWWYGDKGFPVIGVRVYRG